RCQRTTHTCNLNDGASDGVIGHDGQVRTSAKRSGARMELVIKEIVDGIATLTLNRPEAMNALSLALQAEIAQQFEAISTDDAVKVIILTGAGERAFSAGLDLKEVGKFGLAMGVGGRRRDSLAAPLDRCPKPIIGAVNGVAITGGFELALGCDILIG